MSIECEGPADVWPCSKRTWARLLLNVWTLPGLVTKVNVHPTDGETRKRADLGAKTVRWWDAILLINKRI